MTQPMSLILHGLLFALALMPLVLTSETPSDSEPSAGWEPWGGEKGISSESVGLRAFEREKRGSRQNFS